MSKFEIDFDEFCFLVEACIPPAPIARTMFWRAVIDKYYYVLTKNERQRLFSWLTRVRDLDLENKDIALWYSRYNPDNQYVVTTDTGEEIECFLHNDRYYTKSDTSIIEEHIKEVKCLI